MTVQKKKKTQVHRFITFQIQTSVREAICDIRINVIFQLVPRLRLMITQ